MASETWPPGASVSDLIIILHVARPERIRAPIATVDVAAARSRLLGCRRPASARRNRVHALRRRHVDNPAAHERATIGDNHLTDRPFLLFVTSTLVPRGRVRCAAVKAFGFNFSPFAVRLPPRFGAYKPRRRRAPPPMLASNQTDRLQLKLEQAALYRSSAFSVARTPSRNARGHSKIRGFFRDERSGDGRLSACVARSLAAR